MSATPDIRIATIGDSAHEVVLFMERDGSAQAVITSPDAPRRPTIIEINAAPEGSRIVMTRFSDGRVEITYRKV